MINPHNESTFMQQQSEVTYLEDGVIATFYVAPKLNTFIYETSGVKEFTNQEMVSIRIPGDKMTEIVEEIMPHHKARFKNTYRAFTEGTSMERGIPLTNFPDLDPATIEKLKFLGIHNVEALAGVADNILPQLGSKGRELRDRAMHYLDNSATNKTTETILKQNEQIQILQAQVEALLNKAEPIEEKRGPGRPKVMPPHMQEEDK